MPGIANERGLTPHFDAGLAVGPNETIGAGGVGEMPSHPSGVSPRLDAVRRMLDGISGLGWSVIGFIGGAVFWHFVGFWGFVSEVVLAGGPATAVEKAPSHVLRLEPGLPRTQWVQVADATAPSCTLLTLDRRTGATSSRPCDNNHPMLPADAFEGREDRIIADAAGGQEAAFALNSAQPRDP